MNGAAGEGVTALVFCCIKAGEVSAWLTFLHENLTILNNFAAKGGCRPGGEILESCFTAVYAFRKKIKVPLKNRETQWQFSERRFEGKV